MTRWLPVFVGVLVVAALTQWRTPEPEPLRWGRLAESAKVELQPVQPGDRRLSVRGSYPNVLTFLESIEVHGERIAGVEMTVADDRVPEWVVRLSR